MQPLLREQTRKIIEVRWQGVLQEYDMEHDYSDFASMAIAKEMVKLKLIETKII